MLTKSTFTTLAAVFLLVLAAVPSRAFAAQAWLHIDGLTGGPSTEKGHESDIEVLSFSFGVSRSPLAGGGVHGTGRGSGKASLSEITITKRIDKATAPLFQASATGHHYPSATLYVRKAGGAQQVSMRYLMTDLLVSHVQTGGHGGGSQNETVTFTYGSLKVEYQPQKSDGSLSKLAPAPSALQPPAKGATPPASHLSPGAVKTVSAPPTPITVHGIRQPGGGCLAGGSSAPAAMGRGWSYQLSSPAPSPAGVPILIRLTGLAASDHVAVTFTPGTGETITPLHVTVGGASAPTPTAIAHLTEHAPSVTVGMAAGACWQAQLSLSRNVP